jgi:hypothetical protein
MSFDFVYVAFSTDDGHWWSRFLHPTIKHCYVIQPSKGDWLVFGKTTKGFQMYTTDDVTDAIENDIIVKVTIRDHRPRLFMLNTCVGAVKQIVGINKPFIWTPYQLYRYLEKQCKS